MNKRTPIRERSIYLIGIGLITFLIGFLTGASPTPVAGAVITGALGIFVAIVTASSSESSLLTTLEKILQGTKAKGDELPNNNVLRSALEAFPTQTSHRQHQAGIVLIVIALSVTIGIFLGALVRNYGFWNTMPTTPPQFPWKGQVAPAITYNAIDWLVLQDHLRARGYSSEQIAELYTIQALEWKSAGERIPTEGILAGKAQPLSSLAGSTDSNASQESERPTIIANDPNLNPRPNDGA